jgi:hypothetical protein
MWAKKRGSASLRVPGSRNLGTFLRVKNSCDTSPSETTTCRSEGLSVSAAVSTEFFTVPQIAKHFRVDDQAVRRTVDGLGVPIPRVGLYRCVPGHLLERIRAELQRRGLLPETEGSAS